MLVGFSAIFYKNAIVGCGGAGVTTVVAKLSDGGEASGATMADIAPFLRSEGFICTLEGLAAVDGAPLVYMHGLPHGNREELISQILYTHERCRCHCEARADKLMAPVTVVNVRAPSFRFPTTALLLAMIQTKKRNPWVAGCGARTVFVAAPGPVRSVFDRVRPFLSPEQALGIVFADSMSDIEALTVVDGSSLPPFLGGSADWSLDGYIAERCAAEHVKDPGTVREYLGPIINWEPLDKFDETQRIKAERKAKSRVVKVTGLEDIAQVSSPDNLPTAQENEAREDVNANEDKVESNETFLTKSRGLRAGFRGIVVKFRKSLGRVQPRGWP